MGFSLNKAVQPQSDELNKRAIMFGNDNSSIKRPYVEETSKRFTKDDVRQVLKNIHKVYKTPLTMMKTVRLIKRDKGHTRSEMKKEDYIAFEKLMERLGVDDYGYFEVTPNSLFKGYGAPYKYALVLSAGMEAKHFKEAPSMTCQLEVARVYGETGDMANKVSSFLQTKGFGASPNHSMGGQLDYSMAAEWAGIAITGRHSMAISKKNGPCHRVSIVYTSIENLSEYIKRDNKDMAWVRDFCESCGSCIRKCPQDAIYQVPLDQEGISPSRIDYKKCSAGFVNYGCGLCISACPFTGGKYEQLAQAYQKKKRKEKAEHE